MGDLPKKDCMFSLLFLFFSLTAFGQKDSNALPIYLDTGYSFKERAADLVSQMTLEEEVMQFHTNYAPAIPRLGVHQYCYWSECQHGVNALHGDLHHGKTKRKVHATSFPVNFATAMTWDPRLMYREAMAISDEARGFLDKSLFDLAQNNLGNSRDNYGNLTCWAPTINLDRDPRWGRTDEAFGEDPFLTSVMAAAFVNGLQGQTMDGRPETKYLKVAATAKHYALNNIENNRKGVSSNTGNEALRDYYTSTFRYLIKKAGLAGIMTAYNAVNGIPSVASTYMIDLLAKRTYGFDGYTTSDCGAVGTVYRKFPYGHFWAPPGWRIAQDARGIIWINENNGDTLLAAAGAQAYALRAGTSLNCTGGEYKTSYIRADINAGILSKGAIDRALASVFTIRMRTGEFDPRANVPYTKITKRAIESPAHQKLAEKVAENALVLLKNKPLPGKKPLLPLNPKKIHHILILGDLANHAWLGGYSGDPDFKVSAVKGITKVFKDINPAMTVTFDETGASTTAETPVTLSDTVKTDIQQADAVIIFIGTNESVAREAHDRAGLAIPGNQKSLIYQVARQGNKHMILAIQSDGPLNIGLVQHFFPAIIFSGYNGEAQGLALADVLIGKHDPSGHLNFTWYLNDTQLPDKSNYYLKPGKTHGLGRTYMYFTKKPLYPFGYGLSYTRFRYSKMSISRNHITPDDSITVSFDVTNMGNVSGSSVAQLYVAFPPIKGLELPVKKLEGFKKTKILLPGETQHITLKIKALQFKRWNEEDMKNVVYNGSYQFQLCKNSGFILDSQRVYIQGKIMPEVTLVTVEPENLIFKAGDRLDLKGKNKWIESDIDKKRSQPHLTADHIVEAVRDDGTFLDPADAQFIFKSSNKKIAQVSNDGIVRFKNPGVVTITATIDGVSGAAVFVVK